MVKKPIILLYMKEIIKMYPDELPVKGRIKDLRNQKFGRLTVLYRVANTTKDTHAMWKCQCECGNIINVTSTHLQNGHTLSCGCYAKEVRFNNRFEDLTGQRFGKLVVKKLDKFILKSGGTKIATWLCQCDCDPLAKNLISVRTYNLKNGHTQSCGCLRSKGEQKIIAILEEFNINYKNNYTFKDGVYPDTNYKMIFDFYINDSYIIEFDGAQHYRSMDFFGGEEGLNYNQTHDKIKNEYCRNHNIPLIRIPYWKLKTLNIKDLQLETTKYLVGDKE